MSGCMASARDRRRSSGKTYRAKTMPHAMKLNAMLIPNKASGGMIDSFPQVRSGLQGACCQSDELTNLATGHLVRLLMPQALIRYIGATISKPNPAQPATSAQRS